MMEWEPVIGLEVHIQLLTKSKLFSGASTQYGALPNTQACALDLAMPGTLPVLNKAVVDMAIKLGLAIHGNIAPVSSFARKNYFYPDLPKGYQISQYDEPIITKGYLDVAMSDGNIRRINITRAHLEEDAGKSLHEGFKGMSGIDLNRAGTPLIEIVSEPELFSADEAVRYLKTLHALVCYLEICDGNMQEGSFRCDANVSVRPKGEKTFGTRTETKNVNSFRYVEKAILYEIERQIQVLSEGGRILQETRLYDPDTNTTRAMRSKESANDYRYFPEPDLLCLRVHPEWIAEIETTLPELPQAKLQRFQEAYGLSAYDASVLVASKALADYFEMTVKTSQAPAKLVANWVNGDLAAALNRENKDITESPVSATSLANLLNRIHDETISGKIAKTIFEAMLAGEGEADAIIEARGLKQITDSASIAKLIDEIVTEHPEQVAAYQAGKVQLFGFFVGQVMKRTQGKANPEQVNTLLTERLT